MRRLAAILAGALVVGTAGFAAGTEWGEETTDRPRFSGSYSGDIVQQIRGNQTDGFTIVWREGYQITPSKTDWILDCYTDPRVETEVDLTACKVERGKTMEMFGLIRRTFTHHGLHP